MWSHIWNRERAEESLYMYSRDCLCWLTRMVTPFTTTTLFVDYLHGCITALQSVFEYVCELQPGRYIGPLYDVKYFYCVQRKYLKKTKYLMFIIMWSLHLQKRPSQSLFYWNKSAKVALQMCNIHLFWHWLWPQLNNALFVYCNFQLSKKCRCATYAFDLDPSWPILKTTK